MPFPQYIIRPRRIGEGFILTGPRIPYPLSYLNEIAALDYTHHVARDTGGAVWLVNTKGFPVIAETIVRSHDPKYMGE